MPAYAIVGMQWGDEGKGKVVDYLTERADMVVRHQGGNNAGHTVVVEGRQTILHLIPSGILHPDTVCVIANGTVLDPAVLVDELDQLEKAGHGFENRLFISGGAHMILPHHKEIDRLQESLRGEAKIGTTGRGIGPAYADKAERCGVRFADFADPARFREQLESVLEYKNAIITKVLGGVALVPAQVFEEYQVYADRLRPFLADTTTMIHEALAANRLLVFEGAQGAMLDLDQGTFPYVTSSTTVAGGACAGAGLGPKHIAGVIGIVKAYTTRVGEGPLPTELHGEEGERLRERGHEFGATTGRPRRCGWFDAVQLRHAVQVNGATHLVITKPDVLDDLETIKVCTEYEIDGKRTKVFPSRISDLEKVQPVYEELPGWCFDIGECRSWDDMPANARAYIERIEALLDVPVAIISVGPGRAQTITRTEPF